jgi:hypothetical protein
MAIHLFSVRPLVEKLAAGAVPAADQAKYLMLGFVVWLLPVYLYISPSSASRDPQWLLAMTLAEGFMLAVVNVAGVSLCLRRCTVDPDRHFMKDFGCLYLPVSVLVLAATWGAFHAVVWTALHFGVDLPDFFWSKRTGGETTLHRLYDTLRYLVIVGQTFLIYWLVGVNIERVAELREPPAP